MRCVKLPFGTARPLEQNDGEEVVQDVELAGSASWSTTPRVKRSMNLSCTGGRAGPSARQSAGVATPGRDSGLAAGVAADEPLLRLRATVVSAVPRFGLGSVTKSKQPCLLQSIAGEGWLGELLSNRLKLEVQKLSGIRDRLWCTAPLNGSQFCRFVLILLFLHVAAAAVARSRRPRS